VSEGQRVAVVIPAFNEERLIAGTVSRVPAWIDLIVVVDDASDDNTIHAVPMTSRVVTLRQARNKGVGAAIATGYAHAIGAGCAVVAVMAGDGQMDPDDLARVVRPAALNQADYVKGDRFAHADAAAGMPLHRRWAGRALAVLTRLAAKTLALSDSQCGYTAIRAEAARLLPMHELYPRYGYPNDMVGRVVRAGLRIKEVPVRPVYRGEKSGLRPRDLAVIAGILWRIRARRTRAIVPEHHGR
jgi:glycosyltransferase involved in cell wall biosynthesis